MTAKNREFHNCSVCGVVIERPASGFKNARHGKYYCSAKCRVLGSASYIANSLKGNQNGKGNYKHLQKYLKENKPANYSTVGKQLICEQCHRLFDTHPYKIREGKGKYCSLDCYRAAIANPDRPEQTKERFTREYKEWKRAVLERDNFTCQKCGATGAGLAAHHNKSFKDNPELRIDLDNGITLCRNCHYEIHYGRKFEYGKCLDCGGKCSLLAERCRKCDNLKRQEGEAERQEKWDRVVVLYSGGLSTREVGERVGLDSKSIRRILGKMNIETRSRSEGTLVYWRKRKQNDT